MNDNRKQLIEQMEARINRLQAERLQLHGKYLGMLMQHDRCHVFAADMKRLDGRISNLRLRLQRLRGLS